MSSSIAFLSRENAPVMPARRWPAWLLPLAILLGFAGLFFLLFRDRLLPAQEVKVATVLATSEATADGGATAASQSAALLFQASGWVEPDPYAVKAAALIDGVVSSVHVLEGQMVKKRELIASLVDDDARLKLASAESRLSILMAERAANVSAVAAGVSTKASIAAEVLAAETLESEAQDQFNRFEKLRGTSVSELDVTAARLRLKREQATLAAARARLGGQLAQISQLEAATKTRDEEIAQARVAIAQEKLALDRTRILAPITGRVLRLTAIPGEKKMLGMDHPDSSTIAVLYDPKKVQVRVDVPLAEAAKMQVGQKTKVHCSVLPDQAFEGEVTRITGEADLQRNTLQAKVRIIAPSDVLRPEMLCRVEFFGTQGGMDHNQTQPASSTLSIWVPSEALQNGAVWVVDADSNRATKRTVKATTEQRDGYVLIQEGIRPGEQVVLAPGDLQEGQRVKPTLTQP